MNDVDARGSPESWLLVFHTTTGRPWLDALIPGRFKHVSACCWLDDPGVWVFYDVGWRQTSIKVLPGEAGDIWAARIMASRGSVAVKVRAVRQERMLPFAGWCVPAVKRLIGFRGRCVAPTGLYRNLVRANAEIIHDSRPALDTAVPRGA